MQTIIDLENSTLPNGKSIKLVNQQVRQEVEKIYLECWQKGVSVPFRDGDGELLLANPDGSEDLVEFDVENRTYKILKSVKEKGMGRYAYLLG